MPVQAEEFADPQGLVDHTLNTMGKAQEQGWRVMTLPPDEDGSVPSVSLTVTDSSVGEGGPI